VKLSLPVHGSDIAVLKRVAVPDKEALASMRTEVDTMVRVLDAPLTPSAVAAVCLTPELGCRND